MHIYIHAAIIHLQCFICISKLELTNLVPLTRIRRRRRLVLQQVQIIADGPVITPDKLPLQRSLVVKGHFTQAKVDLV